MKNLLLILCFLLFISSSSIEAQVNSNYYYTIQSKVSGHYLDVKGSSKDPKTPIWQYKQNNTDAQKWKFIAAGSGYYYIQSKVSGLYLDVKGGSTSSGVIVWQYSKNGSNAQKWRLQNAGGGYYYIQSKVSGHYLDVKGSSQSSGATVWQYKFNGSDAQKWRLRVVATSPPPPRTGIKEINYLGNYPSDRDNNWSDNLQGVTHDSNNWYFTQLTKLWKFPFSHNLNEEVNGPNSSKQIFRITIPSFLAQQGYNHFCDLDYMDGYLFVPIEGNSETLVPYLLVYKASNLQYIGGVKLSRQKQAGWCAIHPITKVIYSSNNHIDHSNTGKKIHRYTVDFNRLKNNEVVILFKDYYNLYNETGSRKQDLKEYMQGGDFSEDGDFLFLVNGKENDETPAKDGGVWVFHNATGRKFTKSFSQTSDFDDPNYTETSINRRFRYEYHPGGLTAEEPEGITVGNITGKGAPNISGQVHVIMLDVDLTTDDEMYFKHYQIVK